MAGSHSLKSSPSRKTAAAAAGALAACLLLPVAADLAGATGTRTVNIPFSSGRLVNGGFEQPAIPAGTNYFTDQVPGWSVITEAPEPEVELWSDGFDGGDGNGGVPADTGKQFLELNASLPTEQFQDVATTPGEKLVWSLAHRGRDGEDTMLVRIGPPDRSKLQPQTPQGRSSPDIVDGDKQWGHWQGTYVVPEGQHTTRIALTWKSASSGRHGVGNLIDSVYLGAEPSVQATVSADRVQRRDALTYTTVVDNSDGDSPMHQPVFTQDLPPHTTFVPGSLRVDNEPVTEQADSDRGAVDGEGIRIRLGAGATSGQDGELDAGQKTTVSYQLRVADDAPPGTVIRHRPTITHTLLPGQERTTLANETATELATADLSVSGAFTPAPLKAGKPAQYEVTVVNNGPDPALDVSVTGDIPTALTEASAAMNGATCDTSDASKKAVCRLPVLNSGQSAVMTVKGNVPAGHDPDSTVSAQAGADSRTADPAPANNSLSLEASAEASADLSLAMRIDNDQPQARQTVTYTVTAHNAGPSDARQVQITDDLPEGFTLHKATPSAGNFTDASGLWDLGTLRVGENAELTLTGQLPANTAEVTNTAQITRSTTPDPDSTPGKGNPGDDHVAQVTTAVTQVADLEVDKSVDTEQTRVGDRVTFDITVSNQGPSNATDVKVTDQLPPGLTHHSDDSDGAYNPDTGQWTITALPAGLSRTLKIEVQVDATGSITNQINAATSAAVDPSPCVWDCARATIQADKTPTTDPSSGPSEDPSRDPSEEPSSEPTPEPSGTPSATPSPQASPGASTEPDRKESSQDSSGDSLATTGAAAVAGISALACLFLVGGALTVYALRRRR
ncbi:hypothetical protein SSP24_72390 [Streptomyces spinoverrucosus]|uniref:DUF11 domain-containing protein n=1 Tax=Streptomyces spinoverrucosus TaxID=284043 RepID=A0A4Y3VRK0_9ACTN|nr:CARDB domain-containing protein [Streptomyces spinoverrucosus]GEC09584.1 hypothetical protein SSP24_72390 [Streptomyces spinoverrucosus]GHB96107.1 hypothetical protein GCM10010397_80990 [Streptomyces spinoverrucosus]